MKQMEESKRNRGIYLSGDNAVNNNLMGDQESAEDKTPALEFTIKKMDAF